MNDDDNKVDAPTKPVASLGSASKTVRVIHELRRRGFTGDVLACCAGVSHNTIRQVLRTGRMPERRHAAESLERFCRANANAQTRADLRLT